MNTLNLLIGILIILIGIGIIRVILKSTPLKLKTFNIKDGIYYIVNVKSIKEAVEIADDHNIFISKEDLEKVDINIPKRWRNLVLPEEVINEIAITSNKCHTEDK